jgi:hypothetical protein
MFIGGYVVSANFFSFLSLKGLKPAVRTILILLILLIMVDKTFAQKQLVILRKQKVMLRLYPGDEIILKLKNSKNLKRTYINNLLENAVVTHRDTVSFQQIERIYFKHPSTLNVIGTKLVVGGVVLLLFDQANNTWIRGNEMTFDKGFTTGMLGVIGVGLPLMLIRKKSEKIGYRNRLMIVSPGSFFYKPDTRSYISPYMENQE